MMTLDIDFATWLSLIGCLLGMSILWGSWLKINKEDDKEICTMGDSDEMYIEELKYGEVMVSYYSGEVKGRLDVVVYPNVGVVTVHPTCITIHQKDGQIAVIQLDTIVEYHLKGVILNHV